MTAALDWMPWERQATATEGDGYELTRLGMPLCDHLAAKQVAGRADKTLRDRRVYVGAFAVMWPDVDVKGGGALYGVVPQ